jgi:hypothetical protein
MKRFFSRSSSLALTAHIKHEETVFVDKREEECEMASTHSLTVSPWIP